MSVGYIFFICYKFFFYYVSKDRGLCGRGLFVPFVWLSVGCVRWGVCMGACVLGFLYTSGLVMGCSRVFV